MSMLDEVLTDLGAESDDLDAVVAPLDDLGWRTQTPAKGWDVATSIAHLAWTDEATVAAATGSADWDRIVVDAGDDLGSLVDRAATAGAEATPTEILSRWRRSRTALGNALRSVPRGTRTPWFGPPMSATSAATARFMETWAHSVDVHEALGVPPPRTDRVRHVALLGVLSGSAYDFALRVTQRRHRDDLALVAEGRVANEWLDLAQAFAGPPGPGRGPVDNS